MKNYFTDTKKEIIWSNIELKITKQKNFFSLYLLSSLGLASLVLLLFVMFTHFGTDATVKKESYNYLYSDLAEVPDYGTSIENYFL